MATPSQLSFLPDDYLERKAQRRTNVVCAVLFLLVISGLITAFTLRQRTRKELDMSFKRVEEEFIREAKNIERVRTMQDNQKRMAHQAELTASLLEKVSRSYILAELTNSLPAKCKLMDFELTSKPRQSSAAAAAKKVELSEYEKKKMAREKGAAPAPTVQPAVEVRNYDVTIKLTGVAPTHDEVAKYVGTLSEATNLFKEVKLVVSEEHTAGEEGEKVRRFTIELTLSPTAEAKPGDKSLSPDGQNSTARANG
jgi:hypothetical protein